MPYTIPLNPPPSFPSAHAPIADAEGKPTPEFVRWMDATREWMDRIYAGAVQVTPP